jgi:hypothetical protein
VLVRALGGVLGGVHLQRGVAVGVGGERARFHGARGGGRLARRGGGLLRVRGEDDADGGDDLLGEADVQELVRAVRVPARNGAARRGVARAGRRERGGALSAAVQGRSRERERALGNTDRARRARALPACTHEPGPSTPVTTNCACGKSSPSMPMKGMEPPSPK